MTGFDVRISPKYLHLTHLCLITPYFLLVKLELEVQDLPRVLNLLPL